MAAASSITFEFPYSNLSQKTVASATELFDSLQNPENSSALQETTVCVYRLKTADLQQLFSALRHYAKLEAIWMFGVEQCPFSGSLSLPALLKDLSLLNTSAQTVAPLIELWGKNPLVKMVDRAATPEKFGLSFEFRAAAKPAVVLKGNT